MPLFGYLWGADTKANGNYLLLGILLLGINGINIAIVKFVLAKKSDIVSATRQINCIRQAVLATTFAQMEGRYPSSSQELKEHDTTYWKMLGRHIKFPIDNDGLRQKYNNPYILFMSADYFAVVVIAGFTVIVSFLPLAWLLSDQFMKLHTSTPISAMLLGVVGGAVGVLFPLTTFFFVRSSIREVDKALSPDEGARG